MERDKLMHFLVCEIMVMLIAIACVSVGLEGWSFLVAPVVTMAVGIGKELYDRKTTGFDKWDLLADFFGTVTGLALIFAGVISTL
jgi:uncharacterized membrane protein